MELKVHILDGLDEKTLSHLQQKIHDAFPFPIKVSFGKRFSVSEKNVASLVDMNDADDIFSYDAIEVFGSNFYNLTNVTSIYPGKDFARLFFLNASFYHKSIDAPDQFQHHVGGIMRKRVGAKDDSELEAVFEVDGTVDLKNNHLLVGGVGFEHDVNYSIIFHEFFHPLHYKKMKETYKNNVQIAHCNNFVGKERCIMNPPKDFVYYQKDPQRTPSSTRFCTECTKFLVENYV